jgi:hypothetical protein
MYSESGAGRILSWDVAVWGLRTWQVVSTHVCGELLGRGLRVHAHGLGCLLSVCLA